MSNSPFDPKFPCFLRILVPLPTHRLALSALRALSVDAELSPLVHRSFSLCAPDTSQPLTANKATSTDTEAHPNRNVSVAMQVTLREDVGKLTVLRTEYKATTNRMLRVAVNGFMESLGVVLGVMEELDADVLVKEVK